MEDTAGRKPEGAVEIEAAYDDPALYFESMVDGFEARVYLRTAPDGLDKMLFVHIRGMETCDPEPFPGRRAIRWKGVLARKLVSRMLDAYRDEVTGFIILDKPVIPLVGYGRAEYEGKVLLAPR